MTYGQWIARMEGGREGESVRDGMGDKGHDGICLVYRSKKGRLAERAVEDISCYFAEHPEAMIAYGDEDVQDEALGRRSPWFKPEWSPDTFKAWFYFGSVVAVRRSFLERYGGNDPDNGSLEEDSARELRTVQWVRALVEASGGFTPGSRAVGHIPKILFHNESQEAQIRYLTWKTDQGAQEDRWKPSLSGDQGSEPAVSIIIPSRDNVEVLSSCLRSLIGTIHEITYEIIIVDNGSTEENQRKIKELISLDNITANIKYLYQRMDFHFSRMCNLGAEKAAGQLLLFLNDDVEACRAGWLERMAAEAVQSYVGAVGLKLYYPNSVRIQHDGITNLPMGPVHKLQFLEDNECYYFGRNQKDGNVLAVTGACLMVSRHKFRRSGGFCEALPVAFNDVDLCFTLYEMGYHNVIVNQCFAYHHESLSRGSDESAEKLERLEGELETLYRRHPGLENRDPYYPVGLNRDGLDTRIRPAYLTAGNHPQKAGGGIRPGEDGKWMAADRLDAREDACLLLRVESCRAHFLQGYSVVLGDDNACYEKLLVLKSSAGYYILPLQEQYRPDLEENMPDQRNTALSGFSLEVTEWPCPEERCRIGVLARSRIGKGRIVNWSSRYTPSVQGSVSCGQ